MDWGAELGSAALTVEPPHSWRRLLRAGTEERDSGKRVAAPAQAACALAPLSWRPRRCHVLSRFTCLSPGILGPILVFFGRFVILNFPLLADHRSVLGMHLVPMKWGCPVSQSKAGLELGALGGAFHPFSWFWQRTRRAFGAKGWERERRTSPGSGAPPSRDLEGFNPMPLELGQFNSENITHSKEQQKEYLFPPPPPPPIVVSRKKKKIPARNTRTGHSLESERHLDEPVLESRHP